MRKRTVQVLSEQKTKHQTPNEHEKTKKINHNHNLLSKKKKIQQRITVRLLAKALVLFLFRVYDPL